LIGARDACLRRRLEGRTLQDILELLHQHGIARMVDGRLRPNRVSMGVAKASLDTTGMQRVPATHDIASVSLSELGNVCMGCEDWCHRD